MIRFATLLAALALAAGPVAAQTPGACALGAAQGDLDASDVFARVFNTGSLFFGPETYSGDGYLVPKLDGTSPIFAAGLWVAGMVDGEVRAAGSRYSGFTFWPGPLDADGTLPDASDCSAFDRIYVVSRADVAAYESGAAPTADLRDWPVGLGAPAVDGSGAPLATGERGRTLDLAAGERPALLGSQTAFWVMNDVGGPHTQLQTAPLGVEVRVAAYAVVGADGAVPGTSEATFYRYTILNRGLAAIEDARVGFWVEGDLGDARDDYVGTDSTRGMLFFYNGDEDDAAYGVPPALGFDVLSGASATSYFEGATMGPTVDPQTGAEMYAYLRGLWKDGTPVRARGNGYGSQLGAPVTRYIFPGDPVTGQFWSEENNDGAGTPNGRGDRRGLVTAAPFALAPGAAHTVDLAILFAQGADRLDSITELRAVSDAVQAAHDDGSLAWLGGTFASLPPPALTAPADGAAATVADSVAFAWDPVPGAEGYTVEWGPAADRLVDRLHTRETAVALPVRRLTPRFGTEAVWWRVTAVASGAIGAPSPARSVGVYRGGALVLSDGSFGYVEVSGPGGADPCGPGAVSTEGCAEAFGNPVHRSLNSTGAWYFSEAFGTVTGSDANLDVYGPNDFEIRFTDAGGLAGLLFQAPYHVIRVPFEVWDVGVVRPGEANDPADDVRLVPFLFSDGGGTCAFDAAEIPEGSATLAGYVESDRVYAYYPATSYADFEAAFAADVAAAPGGCHPAGSQSALLAYVTGIRPIQRQVFGSLASAPALPEAGTVIRMYTVDPPPVAGENGPSGPSGALALAVAPNPSRGAATVRFVLDAPGAVRLRLVDVLGREVAVLAEGERALGEHAVRLPAGLAAGVYAVEVVAGGRRASRLVTVVR